jgi:hypothetical protein
VPDQSYPAARVDRIEVVWPGGMTESFAGRPADQLVALRKGEGVTPETGP